MADREMTSDSLKILHRRYYKDNPERLSELKEAFIEEHETKLLSLQKAIEEEKNSEFFEYSLNGLLDELDKEQSA
jgi:hypothetical protein